MNKEDGKDLNWSLPLFYCLKLYESYTFTEFLPCPISATIFLEVNDMGYVYFCNNPRGKCHIGDCVVRAISRAMNTSWETTYIDLVMEGYDMCDMPSSNAVWGKYLHSKKFHEELIPDVCTVSEFCELHPVGTYILATGSHVVCADSGSYFDTWDSGDEVIRSFWEREE